MSGTTRAITLNLSVAGADRLQQDLRNLGTAGEDALRRLEAAVMRSSSPTNGLPKLSAQASEVTDGFRNMTPRIQSAGYQLQDFAVQVQGGTSAMTALSQQGSQFLGAFGPAGAVAGAILTIGILAAKLMEGASSIAEINKQNEEWKKNQNDINTLLESGIEKVVRLRREQVANAAGPQRTALQTAERDAQIAAAELANLERQRGGLAADVEAASPRNRASVAADLRELDNRVAAARMLSQSADARAAEAQSKLAGITAEEHGPPASAAAFDRNAGPRAVLESADARRNAERLRGLNAPAAAIERARQAGEAEANRTTNDPGERQIIIANRVAAAVAAQAHATSELAETEAKRFAAALKPGEMEVARSAEQLRLAQALATAETPREALLARQAFEIDKATLSIRTNARLTTDPAVRAALTEQADLIGRQRTEAVGLEDATRNRNALFLQGQAAAQQTANRSALGMSPDERARYLGEFNERQRIEGQGLDPGTAEALQRIRNAGNLAYGDEQMKKLKDFTGAIGGMGSAFTDAFSAAAFEGKKLGDVLDQLQKQLAASIFKATIGKALESGISSASGQAGEAISSWWNGTPTSSQMAGFNATASNNISGGAAGFANGGIMTPFGPVPLRSYAGGGVAFSPQAAIFGEGRTPEAFVPLPDGRSIPVTMAGGGGGPVIQIDARGAQAGVEQQINAVLARRMPAIIAASRADITSRVNRGGDLARTFGRR